jgi:Tfp pilus assembly protein PilO
MGEKERQYILLIFAALFACLAVFYYFYVIPINKEKERIRIEFEQMRAKANALAKQANAKHVAAPPQEQLAKIAEVIPVQPYTEQLIQHLSKMQTASNIKIQNVTFKQQKIMEASELAAKFTQPEKKEEGEDILQLPQYQLNLPGKLQKDANKQKETQLITPEVLKKYIPDAKIGSVEITLSVKGEYSNLYKFVSEVQDLSRYLRVDTFEFENQQEDSTLAKDRDLTATIKLTSYYAPEYVLLLDKLPSIRTEKPSGKWDPTQYPVIKKNEEK